MATKEPEIQEFPKMVYLDGGVAFEVNSPEEEKAVRSGETVTRRGVAIEPVAVAERPETEDAPKDAPKKAAKASKKGKK